MKGSTKRASLPKTSCSKAPCLFLCRNNGWAISTKGSQQTAARTVAQKAVAYGMPGVRVDGNDLYAILAVSAVLTSDVR